MGALPTALVSGVHSRCDHISLNFPGKPSVLDRMETSFVVCGDQRIMIKGKVP